MEFVLYPYQRTAIDTIEYCIHNREDLLIDKSRDMGATWLVLCDFIYHWLFDDDFQAMVASKNEEAVDRRGDPGSMFERMRQELEMIDAALPGIVPEGWRKASGERKLINPATGSSITGSATTVNFSRSWRGNVIALDEYAVVDERMQEGLWTATGDSAPCRILLSTPNGMSNLFARFALNLRKNPKNRVLRYDEYAYN